MSKKKPVKSAKNAEKSQKIDSKKPFSPFDLERFDAFLSLMSRHGVGEFECADFRVQIGRDSTISYAPAIMAAPAEARVASPQASAPVASSASAAKVAVNENRKTVSSPFVGTYYAASNPNKPAYVKKGQKVKKGDVLCIIEAMKLMNEIESEFTGTVVEILAENGRPVEYDEPLFVIETE